MAQAMSNMGEAWKALAQGPNNSMNQGSGSSYSSRKKKSDDRAQAGPSNAGKHSKVMANESSSGESSCEDSDTDDIMDLCKSVQKDEVQDVPVQEDQLLDDIDAALDEEEPCGADVNPKLAAIINKKFSKFLPVTVVK